MAGKGATALGSLDLADGGKRLRIIIQREAVHPTSTASPPLPPHLTISVWLMMFTMFSLSS
jgi:hypothetical protein